MKNVYLELCEDICHKIKNLPIGKKDKIVVYLSDKKDFPFYGDKLYNFKTFDPDKIKDILLKENNKNLKTFDLFLILDTFVLFIEFKNPPIPSDINNEKNRKNKIEEWISNDVISIVPLSFNFLENLFKDNLENKTLVIEIGFLITYSTNFLLSQGFEEFKNKIKRSIFRLGHLHPNREYIKEYIDTYLNEIRKILDEKLEEGVNNENNKHLLKVCNFTDDEFRRYIVYIKEYILCPK